MARMSGGDLLYLKHGVTQARKALVASQTIHHSDCQGAHVWQHFEPR